MSRQSVPLPGINSCERIRPERSRNTIQRLVWGPGAQFQVGHIGIPEDEGSNPRMALRRYVGSYFAEVIKLLESLLDLSFSKQHPQIFQTGKSNCTLLSRKASSEIRAIL